MSRASVVFESVAVPLLARARVEVARKRHEQRERLVAGSESFTYELLAEGRISSIGAARKWVHTYRKAGRLVSVDHDNQALIPAFQLDVDLDPRQDVTDVTKVLVDAGLDGWAVWRWWTVHNPLLDDVPIEVVDRETGGEQVREAAERLAAGPGE